MTGEDREGRELIRPRLGECGGLSSCYAQSAIVANTFTGDGQNVKNTKQQRISPVSKLNHN